VEKFPGLVTLHKMKGWVGDAEVERDAPTCRWRKAFDAKKFFYTFGEDPVAFTRQHLAAYEKKYTAFIEELRSK
jgi:hypothetical protein